MATLPKRLSAGLTPVERETFDFISHYVAENHRGPRLKEVGNARGVSKVTVHFLVKQLERKGFVIVRKHTAGGILPVGRCTCCGMMIGKGAAADGTDPAPGGLPTRTRTAYTFIRRYIVTHGIAPTMDEIGYALGGIKKSAVYELVHRLWDRGFIRFTPLVARGIKLVGRCPCCGSIVKPEKKGTAENGG